MDLVLSLAIHLGMVARGQAHSDHLQSEEGFPNSGNELWPSIRDYVFGDSLVPKDLFEQDFSRF